jgi:hypothetical protein
VLNSAPLPTGGAYVRGHRDGGDRGGGGGGAADGGGVAVTTVRPSSLPSFSPPTSISRSPSSVFRASKIPLKFSQYIILTKHFVQGTQDRVHARVHGPGVPHRYCEEDNGKEGAGGGLRGAYGEVAGH